MAEERIERLKKMHLATDLREGAEIVAPADPAWAPFGRRLQEMIRAHAGVVLPVVDPAGLSPLPAGRHRVLLGNAMVNGSIMALYRRQYAYVDEFYPGGDGYVIRTVHNPENCGHNVLLVGASRVEGAAVALEVLEGVLERTGGRLEYTNLSRSEVHETLLPEMTPEAFREWVAEMYRDNLSYYPVEQGAFLGLVHHLTHDPGCARMFRDALFYYEDLVRNRYGGNWLFEHMLFIYSWAWRLFMVWDLIEESDAFSDAERLRITNILWGLANYVAGTRYFKGEAPPPLEIRQNHWTFAGLSGSFCARYFEAYYGITGFEKQIRFSHAVFDGQAESYKPNDDAGGGWWGYCWLAPYHQVIYDLKRDDFRFLENGQLRVFADYGILVTDNLGVPVSFGDAWSYIEPGRYAVALKNKTISLEFAMALCTAAWYYEDGSYLWALDWMGGAPYPGCYYRELPKRAPDRLAGIAISPFNRSLYEWVERHARGGANVPIEEAFDKLVLRGGFDREDEYLLLDGTSTFAHGHEDGNSIERLTWKGRMWLAELDYIWKRPRHHCSVVSICGGETVESPPLVALKWAEEFGRTAFTRTVVPGYNGVDWTRDIFWVKGGFFLVADSLRLLHDADYDLRCLWRTLGEIRQEGRELTVEQEGVYFRILNSDDSEKSLVTEEARVAGTDPYESYAYADGPIRIFNQHKALHGQQGHVERYFNLMVAGSQAEIDAWRIERIGEGTVKVEHPDGPRVFGVPRGEAHVGRFRIAAEAFALSETSILLLNGTGLYANEAVFESDAPVHLVLYPGEGRGEVRVNEETSVRTEGVCFGGEEDPAPERLSAGTHQYTLETGFSDVLREALRDGTPYVHRRAPRVHGFAPKDTTPPGRLWEAQVEGPVRCAYVRGESTAVGTGGGQVILLDGDGQTRWSRETGAEVRAVHLSDLEEGRLLAGGRDRALTLFDSGGGVCWRRAFSESHGVDQNVNAVTTADLTGDGNRVILAATDGWLVWALAPDGQEVWQRQIEHHAARTLVIGDVEGDGKHEILVGAEYYTSNLLEADGRIRWTVQGGPCFSALALVDLNGDGVKESLYGAMDGNVYAVDSISGEILWTANLGDDVRHGVVVGGNGFAAGSVSGQVALLSGSGEKRWHRDLDGGVTGLVLLRSRDEEMIVAGTSEGWIVFVSLEGEVIGSHRMEAGVTVLTPLALHGVSGLLVGTEGGEVSAVSPGPASFGLRMNP